MSTMPFAWIDRPAIRNSTGVWALAIIGLLCVVPPAIMADEAVVSYRLFGDLTAELGKDAGISFHLDTKTTPVLTLAWPMSEARRRTQSSTFTAVFTEGARGGLRGFARDADDDHDGRTDEDRADGRDNDGDGETDEDFAAIGEDMAIVDLLRNGRSLHVETYHWGYAHLRATIFVSGRRDNALGDGDAAPTVVETTGTPWRQTTVKWNPRGHTTTGDRSGLVVVTLLSAAEAGDVDAELGHRSVGLEL